MNNSHEIYNNLDKKSVTEFQDIGETEREKTAINAILTRVNANPLFAKQFNDFAKLERGDDPMFAKADICASREGNTLNFSPTYLTPSTFAHEIGHVLGEYESKEKEDYPTPHDYALAKCLEEADAVMNEYRILKWDLDNNVLKPDLNNAALTTEYLDTKERFRNDELFLTIEKGLNGKSLDDISPAQRDEIRQKIAEFYVKGSYRYGTEQRDIIPSSYENSVNKLTYYEEALLEASGTRSSMMMWAKNRGNVQGNIKGWADIVNDTELYQQLKMTIQHSHELIGSAYIQDGQTLSATLNADKISESEWQQFHSRVSNKQMGAVLLGGAGKDTLVGSRFDDVLVSGQDNHTDVLKGGLGHDTYIVGLGDVVQDADGKGSIILDTKQLGGQVKQIGHNSYQGENGCIYEQVGQNLMVYPNEHLKRHNLSPLIIQDFKNGQFGINLPPSREWEKNQNPVNQHSSILQPEHDSALFQKQFDALPAKAQKLFKECEQKLIEYCKAHDYKADNPKDFTNIAMALTTNMRAERMSRVESLRIDEHENWKVSAFSHEPDLRMASVLANNVVQTPAHESMDKIQQVEQHQQQEEMQRWMNRGNGGPRLS